MKDSVKELYQVVCDRKDNFSEGSYTCYLFEQGLDKILKKCGEECSEMIIAAKNLEHAKGKAEGAAAEDLKNEICDLIYHMMVLVVESDIPIGEIDEILKERSAKIGNLKKMRKTDRNT